MENMTEACRSHLERSECLPTCVSSTLLTHTLKLTVGIRQGRWEETPLPPSSEVLREVPCGVEHPGPDLT